MSYLNQNSPMHANAVKTMDVTMMTIGRVAMNFPHLKKDSSLSESGHPANILRKLIGLFVIPPVIYFLQDSYKQVVKPPS